MVTIRKTSSRSKKTWETFETKDASDRFEYFKELQAIREGGFEMKESEPVYEIVNQRGWIKFCSKPKEGGIIKLVQEFYAHLSTTTNNVKVRGKSFPVGPVEINDFYSLPSYNGRDDYTEFCKEKHNMEVITKEICKKQPVWSTSNQGSYRYFPASNLKDACNMWLKFVTSRIFPRTQVTNVSTDYAILIYCIVKLKSIDVGKIIYNQMIKRAFDLSQNKQLLLYPSLISSLCIKAKVPMYPYEIRLKKRQTITLQSLPEPELDLEDGDETRDSGNDHIKVKPKQRKRMPKRQREPELDPQEAVEQVKETLKLFNAHKIMMEEIMKNQLKEALKPLIDYWKACRAKKEFEEIEKASAAKEDSRVQNPDGVDMPLQPRKLLIMDLNGLLMDIIHIKEAPRFVTADKMIRCRNIYLRPHFEDFLKFCFENFDVGIWTSRNKELADDIVQSFFGDYVKKLKFVFSQENCITTDYTFVSESVGVVPLKRNGKPVLLKKLQTVWKELKYKYNDSNTLLIDDSPVKAVCNPEHTAIFPETFKFNIYTDISLGPEGALRVYLRGLLNSVDVKDYVKQNPFGQEPITEKNLNWESYKVLRLKYEDEEAIPIRP